MVVWLGIYFGGGRSVTDWDGTVADAESIVDSCAETSALNSEWDYWVQAVAERVEGRQTAYVLKVPFPVSRGGVAA